MKKHIVLLLALALLSTACALNDSDQTPVEEQNQSENQVIEEQELENQYEATVDYLDKPEQWSAVEVVEENRGYYVSLAPDYWVEMGSDLDAYPEEVKSNLQIWKTGVFKKTDYEGQSLVLIQYCDGMCINMPYSRYAVDEATDTWTLLSAYSSESTVIPGPIDATDSTVDIPELEAPETLSLYETDDVIRTQTFARLNPFYFGGDLSTTGYEEIELADTHFKTYYSFQTAGCIYAVYPDGLMARYMTVPKIFEMEPNSFETINKELTFTAKDGSTKTEAFSVSAGGCGLAWSCLDTFEITDAEEATLEEVGTLDGRAVYLPSSMGERPETGGDYDLTQRLYNAYDNYLMRAEYDEDETPPVDTIEAFFELNIAFLIQLENGTYLLTYDSDYAPSVECGKPVIYLYPKHGSLVNVQVGIDTFTKTIPVYGEQGWTVWAKPNGMLLNLADGLNYPYLFWEGQSYDTQLTGETWTLAVEDIGEKLPVALAKMGFTPQETTDFMEFWLPHLTAVQTPYVEFSFVDETVMDQIAPLTIRPLPDQVLRVFMFYRGTENPGHEMPDYKAVKRYGFTVFEWGGSLY